MPNTSNVLCLDLGTTMGWALKLSDGNVMSGSVNLRASRLSSSGIRFLNFRNWLDEIIKNHAIHHVYFEAVYRHLGTHAAHIYGGFVSHVAAWAEQHRIPYEGISVTSWKKAACGRGHATKEYNLAAMRNLGYDPVDDNEADALGILQYVLKNKMSSKAYERIADHTNELSPLAGPSA